MATFSPTTGIDREKLRLLANEKSNFKVLAGALAKLGGIPLLSPCRDMSNTLPDEKVVIAYLSYVCHQLLLLRKESRAAVCIQRLWRKYRKSYVERRDGRKRLRAAVVIQSCMRRFLIRKRFLREQSAAMIIQTNLRRHLAEKKYNCVRRGRQNHTSSHTDVSYSEALQTNGAVCHYTPGSNKKLPCP